MWLTLCLCIISVRISFACENGRTKGLFTNDFSSTFGEDNHVPDDGGDPKRFYGDSRIVRFSKKFRIYTATEFDAVRIFDNGIIEAFDRSTVPPRPRLMEYDGIQDPFAITGKAIVAGHWFTMDGDGCSCEGVKYKFAYKHLVASDMIEDGIDIGPSKCDLQRLKNIIGDCTDNGYRENTPDIDEALIVTFRVSDGDTRYMYQTFIAVDTNKKTFVGFIYRNPNRIPSNVTAYTTGFILGDAVTAGTKTAGVCPFSGTTLPKRSELHRKSNCRCGSWNKGIYVFRTEEGDECGKDLTKFKEECARDVTKDNTDNFNMACRPPRYPRSTCLELVWCRYTEKGKEVNLMVLNPPFNTTTSARFLDMDQFELGNVVESSDNACVKTLVQDGSTNVYKATFLQKDPTTCNWKENGDDIEFIARLYDESESEMEKAGVIYLKATCDLLPVEQSIRVKQEGILEHSVPTVSGRKVEMFITTQRYFPYGSTSTIIPPDAEVPLGQDLYITIAYEWGNKVVKDKVEPYGIYATDCEAANNVNFDNTGDNRVLQLTTADTGCVDSSRISSRPFYLKESFKMVLEKSGDIDVVSDSDTTNGHYNFVISTSSFDAIKWHVGASDKIYFRCTVGFCYNQAYRKSSRCWDVCGNTGIDYDSSTRRRRGVNETSKIPYPDVKVTSSVTIIKPKEAAQTKQIEECISNVVAYSILLGLMVLLLAAMGVTLMLFVRLQARQRKRQ